MSVITGVATGIDAGPGSCRWRRPGPSALFQGTRRGFSQIMTANFLRLGTAAIVFLAACVNAQAAGSTMWGPDHWLHLMDADGNGVVSKNEYLQFMRQTFKRLDANHDGKLERRELRTLGRGSWDQKHTHLFDRRPASR